MPQRNQQRATSFPGKHEDFATTRCVAGELSHLCPRASPRRPNDVDYNAQHRPQSEWQREQHRSSRRPGKSSLFEALGSALDSIVIGVISSPSRAESCMPIKRRSGCLPPTRRSFHSAAVSAHCSPAQPRSYGARSRRRKPMRKAFPAGVSASRSSTRPCRPRQRMSCRLPAVAPARRRCGRVRDASQCRVAGRDRYRGTNLQSRRRQRRACSSIWSPAQASPKPPPLSASPRPRRGRIAITSSPRPACHAATISSFSSPGWFLPSAARTDRRPNGLGRSA